VREVNRGLSDVGKAFDFLKARPRLWKWLVMPAIVTVLVLVGLVIGVMSFVDPLIAWVAAHVPSWLEAIVSWILRIVVIAGIGMAAMVVFVSVAGMIAGPFNEMLSEAVEEELTGKTGPPFAFGTFVTGALVGIGHSLRRLALSLVWLVLLFILGFVPVIGTIAAFVLGLYIAAGGCAYDAYDAVMSRRGFSYAQKQAFLAKHRQRSLGTGGAVAGMLLVPFVNLVALGVGATAATLAIHEMSADRKHDEPAGRGAQR
jgi:CysZ protein